MESKYTQEEIGETSLFFTGLAQVRNIPFDLFIEVCEDLVKKRRFVLAEDEQ